MTQTVQLKRSATSGAIPSTSDLSLGELAINTYDGKAYIKKNVGGTESIVEVGAEQAKFNQMSHNLFNASANQTTFSGTDANGDSLSYTAGQILVFLNGVFLDPDDYTATNGTSVVLAVGSFVGDIVEIVSYNTVSAGGGAYGIGNLVEDLSPQLGGNLDLFNKFITGTGGADITGVVTATTFKGDGSQLTGIIAEGSGLSLIHI